MSTAWVECWKCDECGFRWIKTEVWPERCASSKCRKRSWNKDAIPTGLLAGQMKTFTITAVPAKLDMAELRAIAAGKPIVLPPHVVDEFERFSAIPLCPHKEWAEDGEQYRCRLIAGHKGKCLLGERI